ncbi:hypothetical protein MTBLM5_20088 [Magnetospirillum sp. LM-5]|uniref:hypothetical protein n=1 Tax=Magnetospirillum sp. LM-5 TaxID=2681466 RepID=UPI001380D573|nr:hypothetical protein [Magnetospirillum sp. LM-5]CAA7616464.1 hypothetical protein MTBLM5_20088 [Magnetospirillum sp. LM-5]
MTQPPSLQDIIRGQRDIVLRRIQALLDEVDELRGEVIPQAATSRVLDEMASRLHVGKRMAEGGVAMVTDHTSFKIKREALFALSVQVAGYAPLLGFLRRSAHERNSYEFYGPLVDLARKFLGDETDVVLSSEWDSSPFARYSDLHIDDLQVVFVGLPVTEAANPLVIPLAGHELGHVLWSKLRSEADALDSGIESVLKKPRSADRDKVLAGARAKADKHPYLTIRKAIKDNLVSAKKDGLKKISPDAPEIGAILDTVINQVEEVFSDIVGLRLFGASYLYAFHYLVCPGISRNYNHNYPATTHRYQVMIKTLEMLGGIGKLALPEGTDWWHEIDPPTPAQMSDEFYGKSVIDSIHELLVNQVITWFGERCLPLPTDFDAAKLKTRLALGAPINAREGENLARIILAGWMARNDSAVFPAGHGLHLRREVVINELILKSIELLEIEGLYQQERSSCC